MGPHLLAPLCNDGYRIELALRPRRRGPTRWRGRDASAPAPQAPLAQRVGARLASFCRDPMEKRQWQVVFHLHGDNSATVRIQSNGRLLMPSCDGLQIDEALGYVEAALLDCHPGDQLNLRAQGSVGAIRTMRLTDPELAQAWLRERVRELAGALEASRGERTHSGLRPGPRFGDEEAPAKAKKSNE